MQDSNLGRHFQSIYLKRLRSQSFLIVTLPMRLHLPYQTSC